MAIYRTIAMSFWNDATVADDYTPEDRYFYLYLLTNPHTNLCGCYEISVKQMESELGYKRQQVEKLMERFEKEHKVILYSTVTKELLLLNWYKYNWTASDKFRKPLMREIEEVKNDTFREYLVNMAEGNSRYRIDTTYIEENCIDTNCSDTSVTVTDTDTVSVTDKDKKVKHKYGEYNNVLLTDEEYNKLITEFPNDWEERINNLSVYMRSHGKSYRDHLATIRNWARRDKKEHDAKVIEHDNRFAYIDAWVAEGRANDEEGRANDERGVFDSG